MNERFTAVAKRRTKEGTSLLYRHISGAQVCVVPNRDENKVFSVSFHTPAPDDTGLPHILEHVVLAGSRKYPVKEPFNELLKGSLYTYLNAMTFRGHTTYPIASCNEQDFMNLMDVYLDAVFFPKIYERRESFMQEGWHYDLPNAEAPLQINGIVYNEMQGAYDDPYALLGKFANRALFPRSSLRFCADGDPARIPDLTYEALLAYHRTHYVPANAYLYLYGAADMERCLAVIDGYLSQCAAGGENKRPPAPRRAKAPVFCEGEYDGEGKTEVSASFVIGSARDIVHTRAWEALCYILCDTPASLLRQAVLGAGLGEDLTGELAAEESRAVLHVTVHRAACTAERLREVIRETLGNAVQNGLAPAFTDACLSRLVFDAREGDYGYKPKGLAAHLEMLPRWMNGGSPFSRDDLPEALAGMRRKARDGYFEKLIETDILQNPHCAYVTLRPSPGLGVRQSAALVEALRREKESMTAADAEMLAAETKRLHAYQAKADGKSVLAAIPIVPLAAIRKEAERVDVAEEVVRGVRFLTVPCGRDGIVYMRFMFRADSVPQADLPYLGVLAYVLGQLDTRSRACEALTGVINAKTGGLAASFETLQHMDGGFAPYLTLHGKALLAHTADMGALAAEIVNETQYTDAARLRMLLLELKAEMADEFVTDGHNAARDRAETYFSNAARYADEADGIAFYEWLTGLLNQYDARVEAFCERLRHVAGLVFVRGNAVITAAADAAGQAACRVCAERFAASLPAVHCERVACHFAAYAKGEAFIVPSKVQYNVLAADFRALGFAYSGVLRVLAHILSQGVLLEELRLKGGAYDCGAFFGRFGAMYLYSYCDPGLAETYRVYESLGERVAQFDADGREMHKYILGAVNTLDRPPRPGQKGEMALLRYLAGVSHLFLQAEREAVLSVTAQDIRACAPLLQACAAEPCICTFGAAARIREAAAKFSGIHVLRV